MTEQSPALTAAHLIAVTNPEDVPRSDAKTLRRAFGDLVGGFGQRQLWLELGWQDIKQRYRRSTLGPLWITIATGVMAVALGLLYSVLFGIEIATFLPHVTVGLIVWGFISGCIIDGAQVFIANEGLIKQLPSALSVHVYRLVWRQTLFLAHNCVIYIALMVIFPHHLGLHSLMALPALAILILNGVWVSMFFGIIATRYRDIAPLLESLVQLAFYMTPIVWTVDTLYAQGGEIARRAQIAEINPLFHYLEIIRRPLLGQVADPRHWWIVLACTAVGLCISLLAMRQFRSRVSYWV